MLTFPLSTGLLRMLGCLTAATGLTLAAVPAAQADLPPLDVSISCNSFLAGTQNEVQCAGNVTGGSGLYKVSWTASGYISVFEKTLIGFGAYCTPGAVVYVEFDVTDGRGGSGRAHQYETCV